MDDKWLQSLVVSRNHDDNGRIPRKKRKGGGATDDDENEVDADDQSLHDNFKKEAIFELPLEWTENDGMRLLKEANVSMVCSIPPSHIHGRWSGRLEGRSNLLGEGGGTSGGGGTESSTASGSFMLDYMATSWSQLSLGMIRGHELYHPLVSVGGTLLGRQHGSTIGIALYHNPSFLHPSLLEHAMYSISFRQAIPDSQWNISAELSRKQQFSLLVCNSKKIHANIGWNLRKPQLINMGLDIYPKLSEYRQIHLYCHWKLLGGGRGGEVLSSRFGWWQFGASLVQSLHSQVASVGIGIQHVSSRGLDFVLSWNRGDAKMRIPFVISRSLGISNIGQALYLSMISYFIQEIIADIWGWKVIHSLEDDEEEESSTTTNRNLLLQNQQQQQTISIEKAKSDAKLQCQIMERQAKRKTIEETECNGLVIHQAIYQVEGGDRLDVTIQLQFWVTRSNLSLPAMSKQYLLGFYNVAATIRTNSNNNKESNGHKEESSLTSSSTNGVFSTTWWSNIWTDLWNSIPDSELQKKMDGGPTATGVSSSQPLPIPTLTVYYDFKGQRNELTIQDHEALKLPNPLATSVPNKT